MTNEISQKMLSTVMPQSRRELGATSKMQSAQLQTSNLQKNASVYKSSNAPNDMESNSSEVTGKKLAEMVEDLNGFTQSIHRQLQFSIDDENGKVYVKVLDAETKDVIREIPSEEIRNMQKQLKEVSDDLLRKGETVSLLFRGEA